MGAEALPDALLRTSPPTCWSGPLLTWQCPCDGEGGLEHPPAAHHPPTIPTPQGRARCTGTSKDKQQSLSGHHPAGHAHPGRPSGPRRGRLHPAISSQLGRQVSGPAWPWTVPRRRPRGPAASGGRSRAHLRAERSPRRSGPGSSQHPGLHPGRRRPGGGRLPGAGRGSEPTALPAAPSANGAPEFLLHSGARRRARVRSARKRPGPGPRLPVGLPVPEETSPSGLRAAPAPAERPSVCYIRRPAGATRAPGRLGSARSRAGPAPQRPPPRRPSRRPAGRAGPEPARSEPGPRPGRPIPGLPDPRPPDPRPTPRLPRPAAPIPGLGPTTPIPRPGLPAAGPRCHPGFAPCGRRPRTMRRRRGLQHGGGPHRRPGPARRRRRPSPAPPLTFGAAGAGGRARGPARPRRR